MNTNEYLLKIKIRQNNLCNFCKVEVESISHLFCQCVKVLELWKNIEAWIYNKVGVQHKLNDTMKILGYVFMDQSFWPLSFVLLITRNYIHWCSKQNLDLNNILPAKNFFKKIYGTKMPISN